MAIVKKITRIVLSVVLVCIIVLNVLLVLGTFFTSIPVFGTIANMFTVCFSHQWLPYVFIVTALCIVLARAYKSRLLRIAWIVSAASLACGAIIIASAVCSVNANGGNANYFQSYTSTSYNDVTSETIQYEHSISDQSLLDIYYKDDGCSNKPVVLYIHGGGWSGGSRNEDSSYLQQFAENGYVAVAADYDLSSQDRHGAQTVEQQLTYAVAWITNHASSYGGDTNRFYIIGDSAGGNLALDIAYKINNGVYAMVTNQIENSSGETANASTEQLSEATTEVVSGETTEETTLPKVAAVSVLYPVTDMTACYSNDYPLFTNLAHKMVSDYMGATPEEDPTLYADRSPINQVTNSSPATCILVGSHDTAVSPSQSYTLQNQLENAGVDNTLISVPFANHLFDMGGTNFGAQAYMNITLDWFSNHLFS
jgi:acetyl esterase/lipase